MTTRWILFLTLEIDRLKEQVQISIRCREVLISRDEVSRSPLSS